MTITDSHATGNVTEGNYAGGLIGISSDSQITNSYATGSVTGGYGMGGLVGWSWDTKINNCDATGNVTGSSLVGGLLGRGDSDRITTITNSHATGNVTGSSLVGGLVGGGPHITNNSYATGNVIGYNEVGGLVGGLMGGVMSRSEIISCYATGSVSGDSQVGGLVGQNYPFSTILNCYSTGSVSGGDDAGGLVGFNGLCTTSGCYPATISHCYSIGNVNGDSDVGGLVGVNSEESDVSECFYDADTQTHGVTESIGDNQGTATNVLGLPTSEMHQQSTFTGWDFINVWNIGEDQTYPYLRVYLPSDMNKDGIVNFLDVAITANQWMEGVE